MLARKCSGSISFHNPNTRVPCQPCFTELYSCTSLCCHSNDFYWSRPDSAVLSRYIPDPCGAVPPKSSKGLSFLKYSVLLTPIIVLIDSFQPPYIIVRVWNYVNIDDFPQTTQKQRKQEHRSGNLLHNTNQTRLCLATPYAGLRDHARAMCPAGARPDRSGLKKKLTKACLLVRG